MDRNIFTEKDAKAARRRILESKQHAREAQGLPPEEPMLGGEGAPKPDEAITRLAKFIPAEALSLYMALAGIAASTSIDNTTGPRWLVGLLAITVAFNLIYLRRLWRVQRWSQILVSCVALLVYALATGGPLVQSVFYSPVVATIALTVVTAFLAFFQPPEPPAGTAPGE